MSAKREPVTFQSQVTIEFHEDSPPSIFVKIPAEFKQSDCMAFSKISVGFVEVREWGKAF
jgi:hypothetical protein